MKRKERRIYKEPNGPKLRGVFKEMHLYPNPRHFANPEECSCL